MISFLRLVGFMIFLLALMVANILLFWCSEQKILHPAGICPEASG